MSTGDSARRILRRNLHALAQRENALTALQKGQIHEAARYGIHGEDPASLFRQISDEPLTSPLFAALCYAVLRDQTAPDALLRCLPDVPSDDVPADTRTAYLRNSYADRAFDRFSRHLTPLSAQYMPSFAAACEAVYDDRCSYCILPLQSSEDGLLSSFLRMLARYDLKIVLAADIPMQDGDSSMRYALLRKGISLRVPQDGYLLATLVLPQELPLGQLLSSAEICGARVAHITTMPLLYTDSLSSTHILFRVTPHCTAPLLYFLHTALDSTTLDGLYDVLL